MKTPEQERYRKKVFDSTFEWLAAALPEPVAKNRDLLDVGSGRHGWTDLYAPHVGTVTAIDLNDFSDDNPGVNYLVADITCKVPLPDRFSDIVVSHSMLEHVADIQATLRNIDRLTKVDGYIFITVAPLYYSADGSHIRHPVRLEHWEHLLPDHPHYLTDNPFPDDPNGGHFLNKMRWSDVLHEVGQLPWMIVRTKVMLDGKPIPDALFRRYSEFDLRCRGFFLLAKKLRHFEAALQDTQIEAPID